MRLPESLFPLINLVMRALLCSPLHPLFSDSILLLRFTGRKSGKRYTTPLRYLQDQEGVRLFTTKSTRWWRNIGDDTEVTLRVRGVERKYRASVTVDDPEVIRPHLLALLERYPADAAYHNLSLDSAGRPPPDDLQRELRSTVMIVAQPGLAGRGGQQEAS